MSIWNSAKAKVQLRLSVQRLRTLQQKKEAQAKASRRDIANLIDRGKIETAKVKIETIINEDVYVELLELLELYCELLLARFGLLDQNTREPDPGIFEGVCSIIHAAPRTELKELHILRDILMHKYGREFALAVMENRNSCVSNRVMGKLSTATPPPTLVDAYLVEIAKAYGVHLETKEAEEDKIQDPDIKGAIPDDISASINVKENKSENTEKSKQSPSVTPEPSKADSKQLDEFEILSKRFAELKKR